MEDALRSSFGGLARPLLMLGVIGVLVLMERDFGDASILFVVGFGVLFLAGARLRWVLVMLLAAGGSMTLLVLFSSYRACAAGPPSWILGPIRFTAASS